MVARQVEELIQRITSMDRPGLIDHLRGLRVGFTVDFSDDYLASLTTERLQHVVFAASIQQERKPRNAG